MEKATGQQALLDREGKRGLAPVTGWLLLFFYVTTWVSLLADTYLAVSNTTNGDFVYLLPAALYAILLGGYPVLNLSRSRLSNVHWNRRIWGYQDQTRLPLAFLLLSFGLIAWMSALVPAAFIWLYFALCAQTLGLIRWRIAIPLAALETVTWLYQSGLLSEVGRPGDRGAAAAGTLFGIGFFFLYVGLIIVLLRNGMQSERLVRELTATKAELEEALLKEKEVAVLRERNRMAREMHDGIGHALALIAVKIEAAQRLQPLDAARASAELDATKELVRESMAGLRASLAELRGPALDGADQPLGRALQGWAESMALQSGFSIESSFEQGLDNLPAPVQDALWHVGREAVLNIVKHSGARHASLRVFRKEGEIYLTVGDDGVGIPRLAEGSARLEVSGHYGIRGMRERLETLGGRLTIRPNRDGHGTIVLASVPYD